MTVKTIYICDKCGGEQDNGKQFWTVGVSANCSIYPAEGFVTGKSLQVYGKSSKGALDAERWRNRRGAEGEASALTQMLGTGDRHAWRN